ncbi:MAG: ATP-binding protein [Planctomycetota bacterium]
MNIDLSASLQKSLNEALDRAEVAYQRKDFAKASEAYQAASRLMFRLAEYASDRQLELSRKKKAIHYREIAQRLKQNPSPKEETPSAKETENASEDPIRKAVSQLIVTSMVAWNQIGGLEETKNQIKLALAMSLAQPPPSVQLQNFRNILFYGPPGTGKTLLAAATSNALSFGDSRSSVFFNVKVSSVMSKYFGESTKIISELYGMARDTSPSVIFLDEFESLCAARDTEESGTERRILSTILAELDGLAEKGRPDLYVMTIAATNRPWDLDPAVLSRFDKKILIPLPDAVTRKKILEILLINRGFTSDVDLMDLVSRTEGFSGRELERLVKESTSGMIAEENHSLIHLFDQGLEPLKQYQIKVRPLNEGDFLRAFRGVHPETRPEETQRYLTWAKSVEG